MRGDKIGLSQLQSEWFVRAAAKAPAGSRLSEHEIVDALTLWAREAAVESMRKFPELSYLAQSLMVEGHVTSEADRVIRAVMDRLDAADAEDGDSSVGAASAPQRAGRSRRVLSTGCGDGSTRSARGRWSGRTRARRLRRARHRRRGAGTGAASCRGQSRAFPRRRVGPIKAGKSRTLLEVAAATLADDWLIMPKDATALGKLARGQPPPEITDDRCVIWVDDIEPFVRPGDQGLSARTLRAFAEWNRPVIVLGTAGGKGRLLAGADAKRFADRLATSSPHIRRSSSPRSSPLPSKRAWAATTHPSRSGGSLPMASAST